MTSPLGFRSLLAVCALGLLSTASADSFLDASSLPEGLSAGCVAALTAETDCRSDVSELSPGNYYPFSHLQAICTPACASSLADYHSSILSNCAQDTWLDDDGTELPPAFYSEIVRYAYNLTCLTEGGRFCNNVAAAFAAAADPGAVDVPGGVPASGDFGDHPTDDRCDLCLVANLRFQAEMPWYGGPELQAQSIYESMTSSCSIENMPLVTKTNSLFSLTTEPPAPSPTCAGTVYTIQPGDDCKSISQSQGIGTGWLITDNSLTAYCRDFPTEGELCLINTCSVYTVLAGDTCKGIASQNDISEAQLLAWNPTLDAGCYNLEDMVGFSLCVSLPGEIYVTPSPTTLAPSIPLTPAPVPTNVADGTNTYCGTYYEARLGDYCNQIIMKFGISLADFIFLNPAINENCTNLFAYEAYCVQPVGDLNTYSGKPGYGAPTLTMTGSIEDSATELPDADFTYPPTTTTQVPLASGTRSDCDLYADGSELQANITDTEFLSGCHFAAVMLGVELQDLEVWNPSLGNASDPSCTFDEALRYCGKYYPGDAAVPEADDASTLPGREGMHENCTVTVDVHPDGLPTCQDILDGWEITIEEFYAMNPSVGPDCSGMWAGYHYCVRTSDWVPPTITFPTGTEPTPTSTPPPGPTPPGPVQDGQPENCNAWHLVEPGDDCSVITSMYSITFEQFREWNPAVSSDCVDGFWGGYAYCVGVRDDDDGDETITTTTTTTTETPPDPTGGPVPAPEPNQPGNAIETCNSYAQAQEGDWCTAFADRHGLAYADFYAWNLVLGADGENCGSSFWSGYWYCIGVAE